MKPANTGPSFLFSLVLLATTLVAQTPNAAQAFRRGNENAARGRWDDALQEYRGLAKEGVAAPSLYWNWAQAAAAKGEKGEAIWALLSARELAPTDSSMIREMERLRAEIGLDSSELSLGFLGDARMLARRFRLDVAAGLALILSIATALKRGRSVLSVSSLLVGLILVTPVWLSSWREPRGVVVRKDAPLTDLPRLDAVPLTNLREGEVVPLLSDEGDFVKIQDASGARGFAHKKDVFRIGVAEWR